MNLQLILNKTALEFQIYGNKSLIADIEINDIAIDSRLVSASSIFFAMMGKKNDGANFLPDIIKKNCSIAVISKNSKFDYQEFLLHNPQFILIISDVAKFLSQTLQIFYPNLPKNIYAITGTNGKTSVAEYTRQMLNFLEIKSASIGTIGIKTTENIGDKLIESGLTTPDIVSLYKNLALLKAHNINDVAIEVSSIGLEQKRIDGLKIEVGAFTNFSQDHLDYHRDMQDYFDCKMILFSQIIPQNGCAVINADIPEFLTIKKICEERQLKIIDYGFSAKAIKIITLNSQQIIIEYQQEIFEFSLDFKGSFQVYNILCAFGNIIAKHDLSNLQISKLIKNFSQLNSAQGRMQLVANFRSAKIFIDFAHTPDALENVLKLANQIKKNRVIILFGCGGDRDSKKRPIMGKIAVELADLVIITDDNPRSENPQKIRQEIIAENNSVKIIEIDNRKLAIIKAIELIEAGDILILAGKGHENYQIIGSQKYEFNEEKIVLDVIKKLS
jgi:UDP-N-acetylmuramyl-tripeptide synthetase